MVYTRSALGGKKWAKNGPQKLHIEVCTDKMSSGGENSSVRLQSYCHENFTNIHENHLRPVLCSWGPVPPPSHEISVVSVSVVYTRSASGGKKWAKSGPQKLRIEVCTDKTSSGNKKSSVRFQRYRHENFTNVHETSLRPVLCSWWSVPPPSHGISVVSV